MKEMRLISGWEPRLDIFSSVIDVEDLLWSSAGLDDGSPVDDRVGLAGAHGTGIDPSGEVAGETKVCFQVGYVDGIRIREQHKAVAASELLEQVFAEDGLQIEGAVPRCAELLKCVCGLQAASEMHVPFTRLDPPFLPLTPPRIGFDRGPDLLGREVGAAPERGQSAFQVEIGRASCRERV